MKRAGARRFTGAIALALTFALFIAVPASAAVVVLESETFRGVTTPDGDWLSGGSHVPCLTAGTGAPAGSLPSCGFDEAAGTGALRLTDDFVQTAYVIRDNPIDTSRGLQISFKSYQYDGSGDGMLFMLIDGSVTPSSPGYSGAALGYASYGGNPGIAGGYVGIAFDVYGAFANSGVGTGDGSVGANAISVRGSEATGYQFISAHNAAGPLAVGSTRAGAERDVLITISSQNILSLAIDYGSGFVTEISGLDLNTVNGAGSLPATLKLGFSAGTGGARLTQEIQDFEIDTLAPDLRANIVSGTVDPDTLNGSFRIGVADEASDGSTNDVVTATSTLPPGITPVSASGTGWSCDIVAQLVTCTRPGTGADRLDAGESYPRIRVNVNVVDLLALPASLSATVETATDADTTNDAGTGQLTLDAALAATGEGASPWVFVAAIVAIVLGTALLLVRRRWV